MQASSYNFTSYTGFFKYDSAEGNPKSLPAVAANFGLNDNTTWSDLEQTLTKLNTESLAKDGSSYKLIYANRHGQGFHNVGESKYGTPEWDAKWSLLNGDGNITWGPDARLTPLGIQQAQDVNDAWMSLLKQDDSPPLPTKLYVSPLSRALSTLEIGYNKVLLNNTSTNGHLLSSPHNLTPQIRESFREMYGEHTCDQRRTKSEIHADYPDAAFQPSFSEQDTLWTPERETTDHLDARIKAALIDAWNESRPDQVIALTSHSGVMQSLFRVVGHYPVSPPTGAMIPLIVKATPSSS
ncbi:phosphoglycerate mutase-like protein [Testicularia cyperi]|uniref:Phosphoglycerate mutase-like protein n=1 Tax=Testicularia cyperi TaxID=1882483 RepID=A0A317XJN7_9BASI|nr:phosphoglycerate mutase-like protein [Testicularia cyperi]